MSRRVWDYEAMILISRSCLCNVSDFANHLISFTVLTFCSFWFWIMICRPFVLESLKKNFLKPRRVWKVNTLLGLRKWLVVRWGNRVINTATGNAYRQYGVWQNEAERLVQAIVGHYQSIFMCAGKDGCWSFRCNDLRRQKSCNVRSE